MPSILSLVQTFLETKNNFGLHNSKFHTKGPIRFRYSAEKAKSLNFDISHKKITGVPHENF